MNDAFKIIKEELNDLIRMIKKHIIMLILFALFAESILMICFNVSKLISVIILTSSFIVLSIIAFLDDKIKKAKKYKYKPTKRFTQKNEVGDISIDENRMHQAIIYLSILEDEIW